MTLLAPEPTTSLERLLQTYIRALASLCRVSHPQNFDMMVNHTTRALALASMASRAVLRAVSWMPVIPSFKIRELSTKTVP